jgi:hypothetical protein
VLKSSDEEDTFLSEICQRIQNLPDLVQAEIIKYHRLAEEQKPIRRKFNEQFRMVLTYQSMILEEQPQILYPSFILFLKRYFKPEYYGYGTPIPMTKRRLEIMRWMYQYEKLFMPQFRSLCRI